MIYLESIHHNQLSPNFVFYNPLLATTPNAETTSMVLAGVLLSLVFIYLASKLGGELSKLVDLPPVLGELVAGVVVGVSALHLLIFPETGAVASDSIVIIILQQIAGLNPESAEKVFALSSKVISILAELGVIILLFEIGLESDLRELQKVGSQAAVVAVVGVIVPFVAATAGLMLIFGLPTIPAVFVGAALTATCIGITSRLLLQLGQLKSIEGQIIVGATVIDDVIGIVILAVVASLAKTGDVDLLNLVYLIISATAFLLGSVFLGKFFNNSFMAIADKLQTRGKLVIPALTFAFLMAFLANTVGLEAILGAFAAGLVLDETDKRKELDQQVIPIADILVPIFFVSIGAKVNLSVLNPTSSGNFQGLAIAAFLILVAIIGKTIAGFAVFGQEKINRLAIGIGMIPRGAVALAFVSVGEINGVLDKPLQAAIIIMVILSTFVAPPLLRFAFQQGEQLTEKPDLALEK
ncbi:cation:proton antiporter [Myxosarcina sp. GI1]|uniref:cation:proton antiporter n=1 Tax=Myxosarcina sp. GI1 TaxID=1541065 RepID=UPI000A756AFA|nr:cation:proton antiporter [Myxosarcina sp. GI1]